MTTGAMVLGAVPLALADGAGAESRQQIGWVIVGGMTFGTLLTLFVVPVAYSYLARKVHGARGDAAHHHGREGTTAPIRSRRDICLERKLSESAPEPAQCSHLSPPSHLLSSPGAREVPAGG